jgi:hypothetical protein
MFFVSRQIEYPSGMLLVEICEGLDYASPDMLVIKYGRLGEGQEFKSPIEAVEAAIAIQKAWRKDKTVRDGIAISFGNTHGFSGVSLPRMTHKKLRETAEKIYQGLDKCVQCGEILGKQTFTHDFAIPGEKFCREYCAEKNYEDCCKNDCDDNAGDGFTAALTFDL